MTRENIKAERRRRDTSLSGARRRMSVDESALDRENFEYRFANDVAGRLHDLTVKDDWEIVPDRDAKVRETSAVGAQVAVNAGKDENGRPVQAVLIRKPKSYYNDDYQKAQRQIDEKEAGMRQAPSGEGTYAPNGQGPLSVTVDR